VIIGTSSTRRIATLKHFHPQVQTREVRGNLQTRIKKLEEGQYDALMLAYAGVKRMGYDSMIIKKFDENQFIPAVGQGSVAVEIHERLPAETVAKLRALLNHASTESCLLAERAYLRRLQGGCSIPVFARARLEDDQLKLHGGIVSLDGQERLVYAKQGSIADAEALGRQLAEEVLHAGGDRILAAIRKEIG
ncbi:MAG: hydroxymethylbilane synthase, partial [Bacteroidota bacterium]